ncbi:MKRN2 opposite strand protein [Gadus macrocephalus]|uniref:MKRN2 opposite strand protein n=1 Tax=Gadus macrocephalus TaxID=80720 RepID=UPI0028CB9F22|nr:MKRN2 opposite strand protein [Gadus macrocephalus]
MDSSVVMFLHCGKQMVCHEVPELCPLCEEPILGSRLEEAPVSLPSPFCNGHTTSCCFLLAPALDAYRAFDEKSELHTGISNSKGVVYNYTHLGVVKDETGWETCIRVVLVQHDSYSLRDQWDKYLESYSGGALWDTNWTRFDAVTHNCYTYCLGFINRVLEVEGRGPLTPEQFTERYVLPRTTRAHRFNGLLQVLKKKPYYLLERQTGSERSSLAGSDTVSQVKSETGK